MTSDRESTLFEFANSKRPPTDEEEQIVTDMHAALGMSRVPIQLVHPPAMTVAPRWNRHLFALAAVLLVVALIGASLSTLGPIDHDNRFASVPPAVLGLSTPNILTDAEVAKLWGCGYDQNVPVLLTKADRFPGYNEVMRFNPDYGTAAVRCHDQYMELIVRESTEVVQTHFPGIVLVNTGTSIGFLNLESMKSIQFQSVMSLDEIQRFNSSNWNSRWFIVPDEALVVDTHTMHVFALNAMIETTTDRFATVAADTSDDGESVIVAIANLNEPSGYTQLVTINGDGQYTQVLTEEFPEDIQGLSLSSDSKYAAYRTSDSDGDTFTVVDLSTGETVDEFTKAGDLHSSEPVWINNNSFVFTNTGALHKATLGTDGTETLYTEPGTGISIYRTREPDVVILVQQRSNTSQVIFDGTDANKIISVNTSNGLTIEHDGVDQALSPNQDFVFTRNVVLLETQPSMRSGADLHVQVIDPVTGVVIGHVDREDTGLRDGAVRSGGGASDGDLRFYSWGSQHTYRVTTADGTTILERIPPPPGEASESDMAVGLRTSPDSTWIAMHVESTDEWWLLDLTNSNAQWVLLPDNDGVFSINISE